MTPLWHVKSRAINELVTADDQFAAWDTLSDRPIEDFGLIVTAEPEEDEEQAIPIHTAALMFSWGRDEDAEQFLALAEANDLPDTKIADLRSAQAICDRRFDRGGARFALTRGQEGILNRLRDSSEKIASMERHLAAERRRRDLLLLKAVQSGLSTRYVGAVAGVSSPAVTYATRRAKEAHGVN